ncbi:hypothetical protein ACFRQM_23185 [Streptomyces sp. NPDC056831]|uniref:hypothetical protein n=1 Tax=Streptomyces sp. NPDC056831 TaxID=3345954 RepID=UPI0036BC0F9B
MPKTADLPTEDRLRTAPAARTALVTHRDLCRYAPPQGRSRGVHQVRRVAFAALGVAAAVVAVCLLVLLPGSLLDPAPAPPARAPGINEPLPAMPARPVGRTRPPVGAFGAVPRNGSRRQPATCCFTLHAARATNLNIDLRLPEHGHPP